MTMNTDWQRLYEDHEIAYLRGDLATSSPESYTLDEVRAISADMDASTAEVEAAMRADFWSMPADARGRMMELLGASVFTADADTARRTLESVKPKALLWMPDQILGAYGEDVRGLKAAGRWAEDWRRVMESVELVNVRL